MGKKDAYWADSGGSRPTISRRTTTRRTTTRPTSKPEAARRSAVTGTYRSTLSIDPRGQVTDITTPAELAEIGDQERVVIVGYVPPEGSDYTQEQGEHALHDELDRMANLLKYRGFEPATVDGQPVASELDLVFTFRLE